MLYVYDAEQDATDVFIKIQKYLAAELQVMMKVLK